MAHFLGFLGLWNWILRSRALKSILILGKVALGPAWSILNFVPLAFTLFFRLYLRFYGFYILIGCWRHYWLLELALFDRAVCKCQLLGWLWVWNNWWLVPIWSAAFACLAHLDLILFQLLNALKLALLHLLQLSSVWAAHLLLLGRRSSRDLLFLQPWFLLARLVFCALNAFFELFIIISWRFDLLELNWCFGRCMVHLQLLRSLCVAGLVWILLNHFTFWNVFRIRLEVSSCSWIAVAVLSPDGLALFYIRFILKLFSLSLVRGPISCTTFLDFIIHVLIYHWLEFLQILCLFLCLILPVASIIFWDISLLPIIHWRLSWHGRCSQLRRRTWTLLVSYYFHIFLLIR